LPQISPISPNNPLTLRQRQAPPTGLRSARSWLFRENGSGRAGDDNHYDDFHFSIEQTAAGTVLTIFYDDDEMEAFNLHRINDRHIRLVYINVTPGEVITLHKIN